MIGLDLDGRTRSSPAWAAASAACACACCAAAGARCRVLRHRPAAVADAARSSATGGSCSPAMPGSSTTSRAAVDAAVDALGPLAVAVDVIGETRWGRTVELDDAAWDESFDLRAPALLQPRARRSGAHMADHGRRVDRRDRVGERLAFGAAARTVRRGQGRAHVARAHARGRARPRRRARAMPSRRARCYTACRRDDERRTARRVGREHPARTACASPDDIAHTRRVPRVRSRVVHHRPDARRRRRCDRAVPALVAARRARGSGASTAAVDDRRGQRGERTLSNSSRCP